MIKMKTYINVFKEFVHIPKEMENYYVDDMGYLHKNPAKPDRFLINLPFTNCSGLPGKAEDLSAYR